MADQVMPDIIGCILIYSHPPVGAVEGAEQVVLPTMHQGVVYICQKLYLDYKQWDIHPLLKKDGYGWEKNLQFIATCPIYLPKLF